MERLRLPLLFLDGVVAVAAATAAFLWAVNVLTPAHLQVASASLAPLGLWPRVAAVVVAVYFVLFNALFLCVNFLFAKYAHHIEVVGPEGTESVAVAAIEESLTRSAREIRDVEDARVSVTKERQDPSKPVHVFCSCSTWEGISIPDAMEKLRSLLSQRLKDIVQLPEPPVIDVHVTKIQEKAPPPREKAPSKKDAKKAAELFHGPEYPIGQDS